MSSSGTVVDLVVIIWLEAVFERCYWSITHRAHLSDTAPFRQTLVAENVTARRERFVLVWPHANGAHSIIVNRFTWNIKSRSINLFRSHDVFKLISYLIAAPWYLRLLLRRFFDLDLRRSQVTNQCIFKSNLFTKLEIHLVEFPLSMVQLIKTNVFQDMDIK